MTFTRNADSVTLEMTVADYESLLLLLGYKAGMAHNAQDMVMFWLGIDFVNEMNRTNQNFTPYEIPPEYAAKRGEPMSWNIDNEKLLSHIVLDDRYAPMMSERAGEAYFRGFIVENRQTGKVTLKYRFKYCDGKRSWFEVRLKKGGPEAVSELRAGMLQVLEKASTLHGTPFTRRSREGIRPSGRPGRRNANREMAGGSRLDRAEPYIDRAGGPS